jgi:hypothetical protein
MYLKFIEEETVYCIKNILNFKKDERYQSYKFHQHKKIFYECRNPFGYNIFTLDEFNNHFLTIQDWRNSQLTKIGI